MPTKQDTDGGAVRLSVSLPLEEAAQFSIFLARISPQTIKNLGATETEARHALGGAVAVRQALSLKVSAALAKGRA